MKKHVVTYLQVDKLNPDKLKKAEGKITNQISYTLIRYKKKTKNQKKYQTSKENQKKS